MINEVNCRGKKSNVNTRKLCSHSKCYGALNGVSQQPVLKMLELYPQLQRVTLCLDNDKSGRKAASRIHKTLQQQDYKDVVYDVSAHKDWNEDLKASCSQEQSESIMTMT